MRVRWPALVFLAPVVVAAASSQGACVSLEGLSSGDAGRHRNDDGTSGASNGGAAGSRGDATGTSANAGNAGSPGAGASGAAGNAGASGAAGSAGASGAAGNAGASGAAGSAGTAGTGVVDAGKPVPFDAMAFSCREQAGALFCADFEQGNLLAGWNGFSFNQGVAQTSDASFASPPNAAIFQATGLDGGKVGSQLKKDFDFEGGAFTTFVIAFDVKIDPTAYETVTLVGLPFVENGGVVNNSLTIFHNAAQGGQLREIRNGTATFTTFGQKIPLGTWTHVEFALSATTAASEAAIRVDGVLVHRQALNLHAYANGTKPQLQVGASGIGNVSLWIDDVLVTR
ncbi:MAG: hypothetical protein U0169_21745 [Polyangiaceae bacterium]